jgi:general secretion pathway protein M
LNPTLPIGQKGRVLALALLLIALAAGYLAVVAPLLHLYAERNARAASERSLLVKLNAAAAELPALRVRVAKLHIAVESHNLTLEGASDAIASATLQGQIEQYAAASDVTIGSTEILQPHPKANYHRIGLRLLVSGSYQSLLRLLAKIEAARPPLVVDNLRIRSSLPRFGASPAHALDASFEVYGFRSNDSAGTAKP